MAQSAFEEIATDQFGIASHKAEMILAKKTVVGLKIK